MANTPKTIIDVVSAIKNYITQAIQNQLNAQGVLGAKNFLVNNLTTEYVSGVTYTSNSDMSVTVSGTPSDISYVIFTNFTIPENKYILSGIKGYNVQNMRWANIVLYSGNTVVKEFIILSQDDYTFDTSPYNYDRIAVTLIRTSNNVACSGTIYPMIRLASDPDATYVPNAPTNYECARKTDLTSIIATGSTNETGAAIVEGTYFYLNGTLCKAKTSIATGATFTLNTNYEVVTVGDAIKAINLSSNKLPSGSYSFITVLGLQVNDFCSAYVNFFNNDLTSNTITLTSAVVMAGSAAVDITNKVSLVKAAHTLAIAGSKSDIQTYAGYNIAINISVT